MYIACCCFIARSFSNYVLLGSELQLHEYLYHSMHIISIDGSDSLGNQIKSEILFLFGRISYNLQFFRLFAGLHVSRIAFP